MGMDRDQGRAAESLGAEPGRAGTADRKGDHQGPAGQGSGQFPGQGRAQTVQIRGIVLQARGPGLDIHGQDQGNIDTSVLHGSGLSVAPAWPGTG